MLFYNGSTFILNIHVLYNSCRSSLTARLLPGDIIQVAVLWRRVCSQSPNKVGALFPGVIFHLDVISACVLDALFIPWVPVHIHVLSSRVPAYAAVLLPWVPSHIVVLYHESVPWIPIHIAVLLPWIPIQVAVLLPWIPIQVAVLIPCIPPFM